VTVELRGAHDVEHRYARADAAAIFAFLQHRGLIAGPAPQMPELINGPTPLAGSESVVAPHAGVITHLREPGARVAVGEVVAEVIDVLANRTTPIHAGVEGLLYARVLRRYVHAGMEVCRIAGSKAFRLGYLLAP
jgi:predicted deacylase